MTPVSATSDGPESSSTATSAIGSSVGRSLAAFTVTSNVYDDALTFGAMAPPSSVAVTVISTTPFASGSGVKVNESPLMPTSEMSDVFRLWTESVTVWLASSEPPPGSTLVTVIVVAGSSSSIAMSAMASKVGASFTASTVIVNCWDDSFTLGETESPSSVAVTVIVATPFASATVVYVKPVSSNDVISTSVGVPLTTPTVTACANSSDPPPGPTPVNITVSEPKSSSAAMSAIASNTGASFTAFTATEKL